MKLLWSVLLIVSATTLIGPAVSSESSGPNDSSRSATLKPLTPIAGTNLVLNTPYKWQDRTKSGCYVTWFWEKYEDWSGNWPGAKMVCNTNDQQWYETGDADWVFERTEGSDSMDTYTGPVKIKNIGHDDYLKTWKSRNTWWVGLGVYKAESAKDMWNIRSDPNDKDNLQFDIQNWFIAQYPDGNYKENHRLDIYLEKGDAGGFPYSFVPAVDLEAKMYNFVFDEPKDGDLAKRTTQKGLIDSYVVYNRSPATLSRQISVSETITDEFSYGFSESLKVCTKVSGNANIPFIFSGKLETSFEMGFTANQQWKSSTQKKFEMNYNVKILPYTQAEISASYDLIKGISMNYTATTEITGKTKRITVFNDMVSDSPATGEMIRKHLDYLDFDGKIIEVKENSVTAEIKGTMVASVGVRGKLSVNGDDVLMAVVY